MRCGTSILSRRSGSGKRGVTIVLYNAVHCDALPPFRRSARPEGLTIRRAETWINSGGSVHAMVDGMPGTMTVAMRLVPDLVGCVCVMRGSRLRSRCRCSAARWKRPSLLRSLTDGGRAPGTCQVK
ncbi:MAG: DUF2505 family protein [Pseudonocardia sp.]